MVAMVELVSADMVDTLAVQGTPEECAAELHRRFDGVADRVCCYFPGYDVSLADLRDLADAVAGRQL